MEAAARPHCAGQACRPGGPRAGRDHTYLLRRAHVAPINSLAVWMAEHPASWFTGPDLGQHGLKIRELRTRAEQALGDEFDVRDFHNQVLTTGALPLEVLEAKIDRWIEEQKS